MTSPAVSAAEFETTLARVKDTVGKINPAIGKLTSNINSVIHLLPAPVANKVEIDIKKLGKDVGHVVLNVLEFLAYPGNPDLLFQAGKTWTTDVGGRASNLTSSMEVGYLQLDDDWMGTAANAYRNMLPGQQRALMKVHQISGDIGEVLSQVAGAIIAFWVAVLAGLAAFVFELLAEAAVASTGAGAPPAAAGALSSAAKFAALVAAAATAITTFLVSTVFPATQQLLKDVTDNNAFPPAGNGNGWPVSTRNDPLTDATRGDRDGAGDADKPGRAWEIQPGAR